jgi:mannosyltransferase OCH1-like enzyme
MNPDFVHVVFNDLTARKYMLDKGETKALRSYQMAPHAAAKADILRLVLLWHEGGVYLDADDKCLVPFSKVLPMNSRFVGYQEYVMSVGNNFLATKPKESVIRSAIDDVARAFDGPTGEPIWLATGPGAITRAFARHFVTLDGEVSRDAYIMTDSDLRSFLASHVPLSYKTTERNWTQQFHRKK